MTSTSLALALASLALASSACSKKEPEAGKAAKPAQEAAKPVDQAEAAKPIEAAKPAAPAAMVELDLAPFGEAWKGYVASVPAGAKLEADDVSRQIILSDVDFLSVSEAPFWADGVKTLPTDKDNSNIVQVSDTEVRWERNPPLGKSWLVDILVKVGDAQFSCGRSESVV